MSEEDNPGMTRQRWIIPRCRGPHSDPPTTPKMRQDLWGSRVLVRSSGTMAVDPLSLMDLLSILPHPSFDERR